METVFDFIRHSHNILVPLLHHLFRPRVFLMVLLCCGVPLCHSWKASVVSSSWVHGCHFFPSCRVPIHGHIHYGLVGPSIWRNAGHLVSLLRYTWTMLSTTTVGSSMLCVRHLVRCRLTCSGLRTAASSSEGSLVESAGPILGPCCLFVGNTASTIRLRVHVPGLVGGFDGAVERGFLATVAFSLDHVQGSPRVESGGWLYNDRHLVTFNCTSTFDGTCRNFWKTYASSTTSCTATAGWISGRGTLKNSHGHTPPAWTNGANKGI